MLIIGTSISGWCVNLSGYVRLHATAKDFPRIFIRWLTAKVLSLEYFVLYGMLVFTQRVTFITYMKTFRANHVYSVFV